MKGSKRTRRTKGQKSRDEEKTSEESRDREREIKEGTKEKGKQLFF